MSYVVTSYYSLQNESFASFSYDTSHTQYSPSVGGVLTAIDFKNIPPIELCIDKIADVKVENQTYIFDVTQRRGKI
jgi:hypothetical protein